MNLKNQVIHSRFYFYSIIMVVKIEINNILKYYFTIIKM